MTDTTLPLHDDPAQPPASDTPPHTPPAPPASSMPPPAPPAPPAPTEPRRGPGGWVVLLAAVLISALVSAGITSAMVGRDEQSPAVAPDLTADDTTAEDEAPAVDPAPGRETDVGSVAAEVSPSVVHIAVAGLAGEGSGSGVVLTEDGYVLTNAHVVDGSEQVQITLPDGTTHPAEVVGADPASDLAVVQAEDAENLPVPDFATTNPRVGDVAVAIGSPFGLEGSVTSGIVSALNRSLPGSTGTVTNMIQTDAAINPGNSGGALANAEGEIIGINTAIISGGQGNDGIGFAIPITTARPIADQLIDKGFAEHAQLGIQGQDIDPDAADLYDLGVEQGALVASVGDGTAAEEAGLERGDIITAIDDEPVTSMVDLAGQISARSPGDEVTLEVVRSGETETIEVTLGSAPRE